MKSKYLHFVLLWLLTGFLFQCDRFTQVNTPETPKYNPMIAAFTSGLISAESQIQLRFAQEFADSVVPGTALRQEIIDFSPELKGELQYIDQRTIEFTPQERLPQGTTFKAKVKLGKLFPESSGTKVFEFEFHTIAQHVEIGIEEFRPYNDYHPEENYLTGKITISDMADPEAVEQVLYAVQDGVKRPVSWDHAADGKQHQFMVDSVKRQNRDSEVIIHYNGSVIGAEQKGVETFPVPSLGSFQVIAHKVVQYPEQHVVISFSDPIRKQQFLNGLVRLETDTDMRFSVEGNNILAYPVVRQNGTVRLFVEPGIKNVANKSLTSGESMELLFEEIQPAIQLLGNGVIIPGSQEVLLPFKAVNLKAVDLKVVKIFESNIAQFLQINQLSGGRELKRAGRLILRKQIDLISDKSINYGTWNTFSLNLADLVKTEPGAIYRIELGFRKQHSLFPCEEEERADEEVAVEENFDDLDPAELSYWDSYESYYGSYDYYSYDGYEWEDRDDPCKPAYYGQRRSVSRNILASNIGLIAKKGTGEELHVTVTDLLKAESVQSARVKVFNFQNQPMAEGMTNQDGTVILQLKGEPFLVIAERENEKGYLKLNDGSALSYSMFDVSGTVVQKGLKGFLYGERGVWRPGDSLYISFILDDAANPIPDNHPVIFELKDPRGKSVSRRVEYGNGSGFFSFHTATATDAPTGRYTITAKVGGVRFNKMMRVETIKPNRLKIDLSFRHDTLYPGMGKIGGTIKSKWLTGATARNLKAEVEVLLKPTRTAFKKHNGFTFDDPSRELISHPIQFFSGKLNESGLATFEKGLEISGEAPGMLSALFTTRVFERSGDFSIDQKQVACSPYRTYVGLKTPPGDKRGMLLTDTTHQVEVVTLDASGNPVNRVGLKVDIYKLGWKWWWESSSEDLSSYVGRNYHTPVYSTTLSTVNGRGSFKFRIDTPEWGRYLVQVRSGTSGHSAGKIIYVDWPGWAGRAKKGDPNAASILTFSSDKTSYKVGEQAEMTIPSSMKGRLLISLESGSGVLKQEWIEASGSETRYRFRITPEMTPNIYVYATLIQPHAGTGNDLPIRLFGVIPILVEDPATRLQPVIDMPDELGPNKQVKITVSEASQKEMTYTIAMVDEGLLDLTRFRTPDPWQSFYAREALGVKTWDLFEDVLGAFGGRIDGIYNIGGGDEEGGKGSREANRFPPMVRFIGPFTLQGKSQTHTVSIPNYIGSVRTMVVAGHNGSFGFTDKTTAVKQPLMVLATLPRILGPDEEVSLPVNLFVMDEKIKDVRVKLETNELLVADELTKSVTFDGPGDKIVEFNLKTAGRTGIARVNVEVSSGRERARHTIELNVRSSNPPVTLYKTAILDPGTTYEETVEYIGMTGTNELELEVSNIPPIDFGRRLKYLLTFPHGCIEQTTSAAFPQLFMADVVELDPRVKERTETHVKEAIKKLNSFQLSDGSFSYWPGGSNTSSWGTSYAGHFMIEAGNKGYDVPATLINGWKKQQRKAARKWSSSGKRTMHVQKQEQLLQAYRLFTLALAGNPELGAMNRLRERTDLVNEAKWRLAAAYALAGQKETGRELVRNVSTTVSPYYDSRYSYGSALRDRAMILETMVLMDMRDEAVPVMEEVASGLSGERWMSTQTTAFSLMAVAKFTGGVAKSENLKFDYSIDGGRSHSAETALSIARIEGDVGEATKGTIRVVNRNEGVQYLRVINTGIPLPGKEEPVAQNLSVKVNYTDMQGEVIDVSEITQGVDFKAIYTISNPGTLGHMNNLALTAIFPSGWEIHNERMFNTLSESVSFNYQDYRDDRVMTYFSLGVNKKTTYSVRLNAAYRGRFYLPSVQAEEMYRNDIQVLVPGRWVNVKSME
ncbi:MAG: MG2 domain-containing protein [Bacteroidota bacterium]